MLDANSILTERCDALFTITLYRPDRFNSVNATLANELLAALQTARNDTSIRAVMITGSGKAFCSGQDLSELKAVNGEPEDLGLFIRERYNPIVDSIRSLEKPVIAAVQGVAAGAGIGLALCCDLIVVSEKASFAAGFSAVGLVPDTGVSFFLPRILGPQRAAAVLMLGDTISANQAVEWGLAARKFGHQTFAEDTKQFGLEVSLRATKALALTKRALADSAHHDLTEQLQLEHDLQTIAGQSKDYQAGVKAFVRREQPKFSGS